tara:strand:- start:239 stop:361 length:123 start_codon:yes stop_codon:yes gene_type:complete
VNPFQLNNPTGIEEAIGIINKAAKLKTKLDNYKMMYSIID